MILCKCRRLVTPTLANIENGTHLVGILILLYNCIGSPVDSLVGSERLTACLKYVVNLAVGQCHVLQCNGEE